MKRCCKCNKDKVLDEFHKDSSSADGHRFMCISCSKEYDKARNKNPNRKSSLRREYQTEYRQNNRETIRQKQNSSDSKVKRSIYDKERYQREPMIRLRQSLTTYIRRSLNGKKDKKLKELVDYSVDQLKQHLESLFEPNMSWSNYGLHGWHIDHKTPLSWFNFDSYDHPDFKKAWSLENLQPKWAEKNWVKGARYKD